jgi:DNA-binding XRE family transcriptional regulator
MNKYINEKIGAWLLKGHTRDQLAKELGISRPALNNRISGESKWDWDDVINIARVTGCTLNELAGIPA